MPKLATRMSRAKPSAIMQIAEKAKQLKASGRDIISFSIGVPNFLPGPHVYEAARKALDHDSGQYGSNRGPDALLDAFLKHLEQGGLEGYTRRSIATASLAADCAASKCLFKLLVSPSAATASPPMRRLMASKHTSPSWTAAIAAFCASPARLAAS